VPKELFDDPEQKSNFRSLFQQITCDTDPIRIDFLKSFQRVRIVFEKPEHATGLDLCSLHPISPAPLSPSFSLENGYVGPFDHFTEGKGAELMGVNYTSAGLF